MQTALGILAGFLVLLSGCASAKGTATTRAANDFKCPEAQVSVASIGGTSFRADGCGQSAIYNCAASEYVANANGNGSTATSFVCVPERPRDPR